MPINCRSLRSRLYQRNLPELGDGGGVVVPTEGVEVVDVVLTVVVGSVPTRRQCHRDVL